MLPQKLSYGFNSNTVWLDLASTVLFYTLQRKAFISHHTLTVLSSLVVLCPVTM